jgi:hypothetical protein
MNNSDGAASGVAQDQYEGLERAKKVFEVVEVFRYTLVLVFVLLLWAVVYLILFMTGAIDWTGVYPIMIGILIALYIFAGMFLPAIVRGLRALKGWKKRYVAYAFLNVFEFAPRSKEKVSEEVVEKLRMIYPAIDKELKKHPDAVDFDTTIEGRKGRSYSFDAVVELADSFVIVEVKKDGIPVQEEEVRKFMQNLSQIVKDADMDILQGIIVSDVGFTEEAVDYVSSSANWIKMMGPGRLSPTLLTVTDAGYQVEWLQAMKLSQSD